MNPHLLDQVFWELRWHPLPRHLRQLVEETPIDRSAVGELEVIRPAHEPSALPRREGPTGRRVEQARRLRHDPAGSLWMKPRMSRLLDESTAPGTAIQEVLPHRLRPKRRRDLGDGFEAPGVGRRWSSKRPEESCRNPTMRTVPLVTMSIRCFDTTNVTSNSIIVNSRTGIANGISVY